MRVNNTGLTLGIRVSLSNLAAGNRMAPTLPRLAARAPPSPASRGGLVPRSRGAGLKLAAAEPYFFAAACSAFDSVSFSGWTMVLLTALRAAPRVGNSVSWPSRCST